MDEKLKELLKENAERVDKEITKVLPKKFESSWFDFAFGKTNWEYDIEACTHAISKPSLDLLERGGKRWRPLLMKLSYSIAVNSNSNEWENKHLINELSVIPELIHNGTLIIDDIEDSSEMRRGKPCVHKLFGQDISINAGNMLYYLPLLMIIKNQSLNPETKYKFYEIVNEEMIKLSFGQGKDIYWGKKNVIPTEKQYLQMCAFKTGTLARMSAKLGSILGNASEDQVNALGRFAESIGIAFQIQDDILNITNDEWGKDFGEDITEGKKTLMVVKTFERANEENKKRLLEILGMNTKDKELIREAIEILNKHSSISYSKKLAENLVTKAWREIDSLIPESDSKDKLRLFANFMVDRNI